MNESVMKPIIETSYLNAEKFVDKRKTEQDVCYQIWKDTLEYF